MNTFIKLNHVAAIALAGCMAASLASPLAAMIMRGSN